VRAAVFNILAADQYRDRRVLDLFAGTGSLGIEALSRGAAWADFVERDRRQCAIIRENLSATGYDGCTDVRQSDTMRAMPLLPGGYSLALLDPPYRMGAFHGVMEAIAWQPGLLTPDGMVVAGHSRQTELRAAYGSLRRVIYRQYGDNVVEFYRNEPDNGSEESARAAAETW
jgi:16S rRNA (guanine(966)-N(2))-methyltransferase RsmD